MIDLQYPDIMISESMHESSAAEVFQDSESYSESYQGSFFASCAFTGVFISERFSAHQEHYANWYYQLR